MLQHDVFDNFRVKFLGSRRQVDDGILSLLIKENCHIAKLKVSVDQRDTRIFIVEGDGKINRQGGTTRPAFWTINGDDLAFWSTITNQGANIARDWCNWNLNAF